MPDRLTGIEVFAAAMRLGGLSAAGRELGLSPAMAARHLDALEQRLGATLVHRTTRRLALTEAGRAFLDKAQLLLTDLAEAEDAASSTNIAVRGLLRVSAPVSFGVLHIGPLAAEFGKRHPEVTLELGLNDRYIDLMEEGWDMAIRIGRLSDSSLIARKLADISIVVVAAPAYLAARGTPRTVAALADHDCLGFTLSETGGVRTWSFGANGETKVPIRAVLKANNGDVLAAAAAAGQGVAYMPHFIAAEHLAAGRLVSLELDAPMLQPGGVYALTHPDRRPAAKTRAWIDFLAASLGARRFELTGRG